jgi:hypothetical protein
MPESVFSSVVAIAAILLINGCFVIDLFDSNLTRRFESNSTFLSLDKKARKLLGYEQKRNNIAVEMTGVLRRVTLLAFLAVRGATFSLLRGLVTKRKNRKESSAVAAARGRSLGGVTAVI